MHSDANSPDRCGDRCVRRGLSRGARIDVRFPLEDRVADGHISGTRYAVKWRGNYVLCIIPSARTLSLYP